MVSVGILVVTVVTVATTLAGASPASRGSRSLVAHFTAGPAPLSLALSGVTVHNPTGPGIPLTSFRWGVTSSASTTRLPISSGGVALRGHFTFEVTRPLDQYSPTLFAYATTGRHFTTGVLTISPTPGSIGPGGGTKFVIRFRDLFVLSDQWAGDSSGTGQEAIDFGFSSYVIESLPVKPVPPTTTTSTTTTSTTTTSTTTTTFRITTTTAPPPPPQ